MARLTVSTSTDTGDYTLYPVNGGGWFRYSTTTASLHYAFVTVSEEGYVSYARTTPSDVGRVLGPRRLAGWNHFMLQAGSGISVATPQNFSFGLGSLVTGGVQELIDSITVRILSIETDNNYIVASGYTNPYICIPVDGMPLWWTHTIDHFFPYFSTYYPLSSDLEPDLGVTATGVQLRDEIADIRRNLDGPALTGTGFTWSSYNRLVSSNAQLRASCELLSVGDGGPGTAPNIHWYYSGEGSYLTNVILWPACLSLPSISAYVSVSVSIDPSGDVQYRWAVYAKPTYNGEYDADPVATGTVEFDETLYRVYALGAAVSNSYQAPGLAAHVQLMIRLEISDDGGETWAGPVTQSDSYAILTIAQASPFVPRAACSGPWGYVPGGLGPPVELS